jgi:glycosyltransferase involved in cell wall biosynthesis
MPQSVAIVHDWLTAMRGGERVVEAHYLRRWETRAAARPHLLIANSTYTQRRILRYHHRDAVVIEPPIDTHRFELAASRLPPTASEPPFLLVSALVPYKRVDLNQRARSSVALADLLPRFVAKSALTFVTADLAMRAFRGRPERLIVVSEGPERARLEGLMGPNITLLPRLGEGDRTSLFAGCRALLHTGIDDFGMVMVEALAAGKPVIACAEGAALDVVRDGETGLLIEEPTVQSVRAALDRFARRITPFDPQALRSFARRFDQSNFERRIGDAVDETRRLQRDLNGHASARTGA